MSEKIVKNNTSENVKKENDRPFDLSFAFRKKSDPENPVVTVNLHGELTKKIFLILAAIGAVAAVITAIKTIRFVKKFF